MLSLKHQMQFKPVAVATEEIKPRIIVKKGDNLFQDLCVETMFQVFNAVWQSSTDIFPDAEDSPFAVWYKVVPTGNKEGFFETVEGVVPYKEFDWKNWIYADNPKVVRHFINSAAGGYMGCYVLGVRDRHWDNTLIQHNTTLVQIDFGFLLGTMPPIDAPRLSISKAMKDALKSVGQWEFFIQRCVDAHLALRRKQSLVLGIAVYVFGQAGFSEEEVRKYMSSPKALMLGKDDLRAAQAIRSSVAKSPTSTKNLFKQFGHEHIDPVWYRLLKKHFMPAEMIMAAVEAKDDKLQAKRKEATLQQRVASAHAVKLSSSFADQDE